MFTIIAIVILVVVVLRQACKVLVLKAALKMANETLDLASIAMDTSAKLLTEALDAAVEYDTQARIYRDLWLNLREWNDVYNRQN